MSLPKEKKSTSSDGLETSIALCLSVGDTIVVPKIKITDTEDNKFKLYNGSLTADEFKDYVSDSTAKELSLEGGGINLKDLVTNFGLELQDPLSTLLDITIEDCEFSWHTGLSAGWLNVGTEHLDVQLLSTTKNNNRETVLSVTCKSSVDLAGIMPLVEADELPPMALGASIVYATKDFEKQELVTLIEGCLTDEQKKASAIKERKISAGVSASVNVTLDKQVIPLTIPLGDAKGGSQEAATKAQLPKTTSAKVGRNFGPIAISGLGLSYKDGDIVLALDGALNLANFQMYLMDMQLSLDFAQLMSGGISSLGSSIGFDLSGLFIDMKAGGFELAGGLLRNENEVNGVICDEYLGQVSIKAKTISLTALGAYSKLPSGKTSLFAYLAINYPIGGIPAFFVKGLALGFGYNRGIKLPHINEIHHFPLVKALKDPTNNSTKGVEALENLKQQAKNLSAYLPATEGQYLIAAGVKFSTFELITSVAVLMVEFGEHLGVYLAGNSVMTLPPALGSANCAVVNIDMNYKVAFVPSEGVLTVDAVLTDNSYVLSKDCKLTGGFSFHSWFDGPHEGDFVVSMGGYHPRFNKPDHYPDVPRLGFRWQVCHNLLMKGGMYAALTPVAIMTGGNIEAVYASGSLQAYFKAGMDFLLSWKPFYYDARFYVLVGASVEIDFGWFGSWTVTAELGADLHVWGPDFTGKAVINWWVFGFTVRFGGSSANVPKAIEWSEFKESYIALPEADSDNSFAEISITKGDLGSVESEDKLWHIVDPDEVELNIGGSIPVNTVTLSNEGSSTYTLRGEDFHLAPMGPQDSMPSVSGWTMSIACHSDAGSDFVATKVEKAFPKAVYGDQFVAKIDQKETMLRLLSGSKIVSAPGKPPGFTEAIDADEFKFEDLTENDPYWQWGGGVEGELKETDATIYKDIKNSLNDEIVIARRQDIANFFDVATPIGTEKIRDELEATFIGSPQILIAA
ncbi:hypothetical protein EDC56_0677 [Sinobacterium caligoides]|uniref:DUF6603 domain-containing protein n=1 Tax=Sinobacterium caligoides TaxID=933926 RepID=A0A3N2DZ73_9GAMM|nr:DUF6603 domain-containing protein [Sinobacterium caligoides]ROS05148.1 hypothetical protein EDC56_0677 [Sinobacterium caligoides]